MPYLFLSFADNLDKDSKSKRDFYNLSLEKQYNIFNILWHAIVST